LRCGYVGILIGIILTLVSSGFAAEFPAALKTRGIEPDFGIASPASAPALSKDMIPVSSSFFPALNTIVPNLQVGFLYNVSPKIRTGRFIVDYFVPFRTADGSVLFGEAHFENRDFWQRERSNAEYRTDLSFGGGFRKLVNASTYWGLSGFYDATKISGKWYSSGSLGVEINWLIGGDSALDANFNYYGNIFNRDVLTNLFRNFGGSYDFEAGYSHSLLDQTLDLRLKAVGYQFDVGEKVYGWRAGADVTTKNGMFTVRYEHGHDRVQGDYDVVGGFINMGFQLENLFSLASPVTLPEPVFKSPRNIVRTLDRQVQRNWQLPDSVVLAQGLVGPGKKPYFSFAVSNPTQSSLVRNQSVGDTHTVIQISPGTTECSNIFQAGTLSLTAENFTTAVNVKATVTSSSLIPDGCRNLVIVLPDTNVISASGNSAHSFVLPRGGSRWSFGPSTIIGLYMQSCNCAAPVVEGALAGTVTFEDLDGVIPTQVVDFITVK
jgi:hypothetical protein